MKPPGVSISELDELTRKKLGIELNLPDEMVAPRLDALGKVFRALRGMTNNNALWVLDQARSQIIGDRVVDSPLTKQPVTVNSVVNVVASVLNMTADDLKNRSRTPDVALARQVAMYVLSITDKYTLTTIGDALGGRSPATISHGFQRIAQRLPKNQTLRNKVEDIQLQISGG